jgi:arylsulfatase A-like enzyme
LDRERWRARSRDGEERARLAGRPAVGPEGQAFRAFRGFLRRACITSRDRIPSSQAVVRRDWKYVEWPEFDYRQLFNLKDDPGELRNLAADSADADARRFRMQAALTAWRALVR